MSKTITLTRDELVWQTRCNSWNEEDYKSFVEWLKTFVGKENESVWSRNRVAEYNIFSRLSWDEICKFVNDDNYEEQEDFRIPYYAEDGDIMYRAYPSDVIQDAIREDNYDSDITDEQYADDYQESWDVR